MAFSRWPLRTVTLALLFVIAACNEEKNAAAPQPVTSTEAGFVTLKQQSVPQSTELSGRVVVLASAEIRPQVDGIIRKIVFTEGREVKEGDVLYELNDAKFKAAYSAAAAALKKAQAGETSAQTTYARSLKLGKTNAISAQDLDDLRATLLQAQASTEAAKADLETAQINLDNTQIKAPISGVIGISSVSIGSLVTENQTDALATIRQNDPIYVDLVDTSANFLRIRDEVQAGRLGRSGSDGRPAVHLTLENGKTYDRAGSLSLAEMVVSQTTGTFSLRATFPNPDHILIPGMFVRASVDIGVVPDAFLVPHRAVTRNDNGEASAYFVSDDKKAQQRTLTTSGSVGNHWIVSGGVTNGDHLIVDGLQKISNGTPVTPVEVTIDDDGVIKQTLGQRDATSAESSK